MLVLVLFGFDGFGRFFPSQFIISVHQYRMNV
jgi:hypothetical protein